MATRCHYSEMNLLRKRLSVTVQNTCERKLHALKRMCDGVYAGSFRGTLYLLPPEFVFKRKRTRSKLDSPPGVHF